MSDSLVVRRQRKLNTDALKAAWKLQGLIREINKGKDDMNASVVFPKATVEVRFVDSEAQKPDETPEAG